MTFWGVFPGARFCWFSNGQEIRSFQLKTFGNDTEYTQ